jgi:hypothetical protein
VRAACDLQRKAGAGVGLEPIHSFAFASADFTRDIGAVLVSRARWLLDV